MQSASSLTFSMSRTASLPLRRRRLVIAIVCLDATAPPTTNQDTKSSPPRLPVLHERFDLPAPFIAAFIAEPVMGAGGVIPPPATYFDKIQAIVKKYDILFIADEVICAFGRLGYMFGCDKYNIKPDLVSVAKALSSAYMPIGAVLVSPEISDIIHSQSSKLGSFAHGFTFSGHPVAYAVAIEALKIYKCVPNSFPNMQVKVLN